MRDHKVRGIVAMLAAVGFFAGMDAFLKLFSTHYPAMQVSALRGAASVPFVLLSLAVTGKLRSIKPVRWGLHLLRGVLAIVMLSTFIYSLRHLPLADAYSVFLAAPLLVTALAMPLLGERVDLRRWIAIVIGLAGVVILLKPSATGLISLAALAALAACLCYSLVAISVRVLTRTDTTASMVFWFIMMMAVFAGVLAAPNWVPLQREHWPWLAAVGLLGALGQHFITEAFRYAPASTVAPFEYTALLWAVAIDWLVWQHAPSMRMFAGGAIIIACGLFLIWCERAQPAPPPAAAGHS